MKRPVSYTMRDVARLARVSVTTVSTVVNGRAGVSPELTRRIADAITTLDYHPNEVARSLKVNRTFTIGMVVPDVSNFFFNDILRGVETKARQNGFSIVLCDSHDDPDQERELLTMLVRRRVDGILLASGQLALEENRLVGRRPPTVCIDREPEGPKCGVVVIDNVLAGYHAARHLIDLGHDRIAVIAGPGTTLTGSGRMEGFRKALQEANIPVRHEYVRAGGFSMEGGYRGALEILQLPEPPTAIFAGNNRMTLGLMRAIKNLGRKCPRDVSVCGFDDFDWSELFTPELTTVVQPSYQMGEIAIEKLLQAIEAPNQHGEGIRIVLRAELRIRESTAPPASLGSHPQQNSIPLKPSSSEATAPAGSRPVE